jgi:hypothetical protein
MARGLTSCFADVVTLRVVDAALALLPLVTAGLGVTTLVAIGLIILRYWFNQIVKLTLII